MAKPQSLDELIGKKAAEFAEQVRHAAALATKEEEIRIEVERQLAFLEKETGVRLEGKHEFTVAKGRIDSFYTRVLIEYKNPSSPDRAEHLSQMSVSCHGLAQQGDESKVLELEKEIDQVAASIWGMSTRELKGFQAALTKSSGATGKRGRRSSD